MMVGLFSLISLFVPLFIGSAVLVRGLVQYQTANTRCVKAVMSEQDNVRRPLEILMQLNPKAKRLRVKYAAAKKRLMLALSSQNPTAIAAAKVAINKIHAERLALDQYQRRLIVEARTLTLQAPILVAGKLREYNAETNDPHFDVIADQPGIAPMYRLPEDFSERQKLEVKWIFRPMDRWPPSLKRTIESLFGGMLRNRIWGCAATLEERDGKYRPSLAQLSESHASTR